MLIRLIGLISVERLETQVDQAKHVTLKSTLGTLKTVRDTVAHTHLKGVTRTLDAPLRDNTEFSTRLRRTSRHRSDHVARGMVAC